MNKIYLVATLAVLLLSCTKNNEENVNPSTPNPTNQSKLFVIKQNDLYPSTYISNVVTLDLLNSPSPETSVSQLTANDYLDNIAINRQTNEIIAIGEFKGLNVPDKKLYKINIATGILTKIDIIETPYGFFGDLVIDNTGNAFAIKENDNPNISFVPQIVKINQTTGEQSIVASLSINDYLDNLTYNSTTNEIIGIGEDKTLTIPNIKIYKINVSTGIVTIIDIPDSGGGSFTDILIDNNENLYSVIQSDNPTSTFVPKIVKINQNTGVLTQIATLNVKDYLDHFVFDNLTNEIIGIGADKTQGSTYDLKLFKINVTNGTILKNEINENPTAGFYSELVIK